MFCRCFAVVMLLAVCRPIVSVYGQSSEKDDWRFECQRSEIAPDAREDNSVLIGGQPSLVLAGGGKFYADGRWVRQIPVQGGEFYRFDGEFQYRLIDEPDRSVFARLLWLGQDGGLIGRAEYPLPLYDEDPDGRHRFFAVYESPEDADAARLELHYRWDADGEVHFSRATLTASDDPKTRHVTLAAVKYRPKNDRSDEEDLEVFAELIARAADRGADIVTLGEGITMAGSPRTYVEAAEPVPGPTTAFLGDLARQHRIYIVAGIYEKEGPVVYNTAVLIDRDGNLAGRYRKVSLPREEYEGGITAGDTFPVFETDFGTIGMMICWDVAFPEAARALAMKGAEVILMPIWGGITPLARARAIENQIYLVSSGYDMETGIFDREGNLMAEAREEETVAIVTVDLNERLLWPWLGDLKSRIRREIPPIRANWR